MSRQLIVVDVESTSLDEATAAVLEVAAVNLNTGEQLHFAPYVSGEQLGKADPAAMRINRYYERGIAEQSLGLTETGRRYYQLREWLDGNTFAGCNPAFDSRLIERQRRSTTDLYTGSPIGKIWHHRLADLSAYAGPAMGRPPWDLPGNADVCGFLDVKIDGEHTALGDARATAECFRKLKLYYAHSIDSLPWAKEAAK